MPVSCESWTSEAAEAAHRQLIQIPLPALAALATNDLDGARRLFQNPQISPYFTSSECSPIWKRRHKQLQEDPSAAPWVTRLLVDRTGAVVGRAGFHGPPDDNGMVEVGYSVDPACRRQGHARAALRILLDVARGDPRAKVVRVSILPDNMASLGVAASCGFKEVGEQWDEEDSALEKVFEVAAAEPS